MIARWLRLHFKTLGAALGRIGSTPSGAAMNLLVVAIALALPAALQVLLANAESLSPALEDAADFTIYLKSDVSEERGRELAAIIAARDGVEATNFISRDEGLAEVRARLGTVVDALTENPIPHVIQVRPASEALDRIDSLADDLAALPETELMQLDRLWIERLRGMLTLGTRVANLISVLLGASVILVIGNTVRLEINNRRTEIEVMKLVGATDAFIRRPFLYTGFCLGSIGALLAASLIGLGLLLLRGPVSELAALYAADFSLSGLSPAGLGTLLGAGALLGWAGAWIAAARHLKAIEPA